jgi:acyl-CoA synthetase (AMP-forming)/AMP-acid ligase II
MNLADLLHASAARYPDRPAVSDLRSGRTLPYGQLAREADAVAAFLKSQGVGRGQRVGLMAPNDLSHLPAAFGLVATGACLVPLASTLTTAEASQIVREVQLNGCLSWPRADALPLDPSAVTLSGGECDGFAFQWIDRDAEGPPELPELDPAFIRFTSGTTATSKGVVLSHEATVARVVASDAVLQLRPEDRILWVLPLAYHFAVTIVAYVRAGAHVLLAGDSLPAALVDAIGTLRPTLFYASPLHFERMSNLEQPTPFASVRCAISTSAPLPPNVPPRFEALYGVPVGQAYGLIEAGLPCINTGADGLPATSVGRPVPGYEVAVFSDDGEPVSRSQLGEIGLRGPGLFSAYYSPWCRREQVSRAGWFLTGDIGRQDETGGVHLVGRKKAVIFVAGLKFFPEEVEDCINSFPGVAESRVFGRPHARLGEVTCAEIALDGPCDTEALRVHCSRVLSAHKVPIEFTVVSAVPRTSGGKILRRPVTGSEAAAGREGA